MGEWVALLQTPSEIAILTYINTISSVHVVFGPAEYILR